MSHCDVRMSAYRAQVQAALTACLLRPDGNPSALHDAMAYAALSGGKRIRAILVYAAGEIFGGDQDLLNQAACAVELVHAYSLIHDDLPCMDDDDLRRGQPATHIAFDEATALLAGDALHSLAFEQLSKPLGRSLQAQQLGMIAALATAIGRNGMAYGQAIDLAVTGTRLELHALETMHILKTGVLLQTCVRLGGLAYAAIDNQALAVLDEYARCIGLAFQIRDDVLDIEADTRTLGKPQGADVMQNKPTYPSVLGLAESKRLADDLITQALQALSVFGDRADLLAAIAEFIVRRPN